ncbi:uncharacterized protein METZ01_LOCUS231138, partial [marine metagenome]
AAVDDLRAPGPGHRPGRGRRRHGREEETRVFL